MNYENELMLQESYYDFLDKLNKKAWSQSRIDKYAKMNVKLDMEVLEKKLAKTKEEKRKISEGLKTYENDTKAAKLFKNSKVVLLSCFVYLLPKKSQPKFSLYALNKSFGIQIKILKRAIEMKKKEVKNESFLSNIDFELEMMLEDAMAEIYMENEDF